MTTNTKSTHERTASIDLAQLDKLREAFDAEAPNYRINVERFKQRPDDYKFEQATQLWQFVQAIARRSLTSGAPAEPITLPEWSDAMRAVEQEEGAGEATPLDIFIYADEPAGDSDEAHFRAQLQALLDWVSAGAAAKTEQAPEHETIVQEGDNLVCTACGTTAEIAAVGFDSNMQKVDIATAAGAGSAQPADGPLINEGTIDQGAQAATTASASIDLDQEFQRLAEAWKAEPYGTRGFLSAWDAMVAHIDLRAALARAPLPAQSQPAIEVSAQGIRLPDGSFITPEGSVTGPLAEAIGEKIRAAMRANDGAAEGGNHG